VQDDHPTILFGPWVEESGDDGDVPPFYIRINIRYVTLHNAMLDSGASQGKEESISEQNINEYEDIWNMDFDGAVNKEGAGEGV